MIKINKTNSILLITLMVSIVTFFILGIVSSSTKNNIESRKKMIANEAIAHFNNMVIARSWNADHGGVYVKKHDDIEPNPYLIDNSMISNKGEMYVKINPAWMTRQISELTNRKSSYYFKITSLKPINPNNKPDSFETEALKAFEKDKSKKYFYRYSGNLDKFDFMGSLKVASACMKCHAFQGYKVGDIRGGIRVSFPTHDVSASVQSLKKETFIFNIIVIVVAFFVWGILIFFIIQIFKHQEKMDELNLSLEHRIQEEVEKNKMLFNHSKIASMGELIGNLAHQWRQPLSTISTAASGMKVQKEYGLLKDEEMLKELDIIVESTNKLSKTLSDLDDVFDRNNKIEPILISTVFEHSLELLERKLQDNGIEVMLDIDKNLMLSSNKNDLIQVLLNILNNSIDALEKVKQNRKIIKINVYYEDNELIIKIIDNATGISKEIIDKIFEPYFTTKHQAEGAGISLYITREIILKSLKGSIDIKNVEFDLDGELNNGTQCTIKLPKL